MGNVRRMYRHDGKDKLMNEEIDSITIINRLIVSLSYLELTALQMAIQSRRESLRLQESKKFLAIISGVESND